MSGRLVLHADDLGMSRPVTDGILRGFRHGLLTSTAVLANAPDAGRAIEQWKALAEQHAAGALPSMPARRRLGDTAKPFDFGVHLNLTQGRPLGPYPAELLDGNGCFLGVRRLFSAVAFGRPVPRGRSRRIGAASSVCAGPRAAAYAPQRPPIHRDVAAGRPPHAGRCPPLPEMAERFGIARVRVAWEPPLFGPPCFLAVTPGDGRRPG